MSTIPTGSGDISKTPSVGPPGGPPTTPPSSPNKPTAPSLGNEQLQKASQAVSDAGKVLGQVSDRQQQIEAQKQATQRGVSPQELKAQMSAIRKEIVQLFLDIGTMKAPDVEKRDKIASLTDRIGSLMFAADNAKKQSEMLADIPGIEEDVKELKEDMEGLHIVVYEGLIETVLMPLQVKFEDRLTDYSTKLKAAYVKTVEIFTNVNHLKAYSTQANPIDDTVKHFGEIEKLIKGATDFLAAKENEIFLSGESAGKKVAELKADIENIYSLFPDQK